MNGCTVQRAKNSHTCIFIFRLPRSRPNCSILWINSKNIMDCCAVNQWFERDRWNRYDKRTGRIFQACGLPPAGQPFHLGSIRSSQKRVGFFFDKRSTAKCRSPRKSSPDLLWFGRVFGNFVRCFNICCAGTINKFSDHQGGRRLDSLSPVKIISNNSGCHFILISFWMFFKFGAGSGGAVKIKSYLNTFEYSPKS